MARAAPTPGQKLSFIFFIILGSLILYIDITSNNFQSIKNGFKSFKISSFYIAKEISIEPLKSILNGIVLSILVGFVTFGWFKDITIAVLISCALVINLISSVIAGILVPLILRKFNQDPAIAGSVIVTTVTDVVGFLSFLGLATIYLI